jgi:hypothetical protein
MNPRFVPIDFNITSSSVRGIYLEFDLLVYKKYLEMMGG